jgi:hypothetical protein
LALAHDIYTEGMETQQGKSMLAFLRSLGGPQDVNQQFSRLLQPGQWNRVIKRIGSLPSPAVSSEPSQYSVPAGKSSQHAHGGP